MPQSSVLLLLLLLCVVYSVAQISDANREELISLHNEIRSTVQPTPSPTLVSLTWNDTLADIAQRRANMCQRSHSLWFLTTLLGETVFYDIGLTTKTIQRELAEERQKYNLHRNACFGHRCDNHKQITNANVTSFGCGWASCTGIGELVVCLYNKYGVFSGIAPYTTDVPNPDLVRVDVDYDTLPDADWSTIENITGIFPKEGHEKTKRDTRAVKTATGRPLWDGGNIDYSGTVFDNIVESQGSCGSCWAFGVGAAIEGAFGVKKNPYTFLPTVSKQEILDCSPPGSCDGGWPQNALRKLMDNGGGISKAETAPYYGYKQSTCKRKKVYGRVADFGVINLPGKQQMCDTIAVYGPSIVFLYVDDTFRFYKSGVMAGPVYDSITHVVTLLGYHNEAGGFYVIKNSWGTDWGMSGYAWISTTQNFGMSKSTVIWVLAQ